MPMYEFRCRSCGAPVLADQRDAPEVGCPRCTASDWRRVWSFQAAPVMHQHLNRTTGTLVSSSKQFEDELRRKSDEATERTGIPHNFVPVDAADKAALKVTEDGLDTTYNRLKAAGRVESVAQWAP